MDCVCSTNGSIQEASSEHHPVPKPPAQFSEEQEASKKMTTKSNASVYKPPCTQCSQIRLLDVLPGSPSEEVVCQLRAVSFKQSPQYVALSYSWYDGLPSQYISLHGLRTKVTNSVNSFICQLRKPTHIISIWIDALCIDQTDNVEKAQQVGLMHRIYRQCQRVYIWLGDDDLMVRWFSMQLTGSWETKFTQWAGRPAYLQVNGQPRARNQDEMFDLIDHFARDRHISEVPGAPRRVWRFYWSLPGSGVRRGVFMFERFRRLLAKRWHCRMWCVQEALMQESVTMMVGSFELEFSKMTLAVQNWNRHAKASCCTALFNGMNESIRIVPDLVYSHNISTVPSTRDDPSLDLGQLLFRYRYKDCKDPRDKVFGILALVRNTASYPQTLLRVNYSLSTADVYLNTMTAILTASAWNLRHLLGSGFCSNQPGIPSWVRDLEECPPMKQVVNEMERLRTYNLYNAWPSSRQEKLSIENGRHLKTQGVYVDRIVEVCHQIHTFLDTSSFLQTVKIVRRVWKTLSARGTHFSLLFPNVRTEPLWRTLLADLRGLNDQEDFSRFGESDIDIYQTSLRYMVGTGSRKQLFIIAAFERALRGATRGRSLFLTSRGHLGLCYPSTRVGDEVWALAGGNMPFVLRPASSQTPIEFRFVGDCYCHGFMDGEALKSCKSRQSDITLV